MPSSRVELAAAGLALSLATLTAACDPSSIATTEGARKDGGAEVGPAQGEPDAATPVGCTPGLQVVCPCLGGGQAVQVCNADGTGFHPCQCGGGTVDAAAPSPDAARASSDGPAPIADARPSTPAGPLELVGRQAQPTGVAVDGTRVYWANEEDGVIASCPLAGCEGAARTVIASGQTKPRGVAVNSENVYWVAAGTGVGTFAVRRCPLAGCGTSAPADLLAGAGDAHGLAVGGGLLYVAADDALLRCPVIGCAFASAERLVTGLDVVGVAVNATHVYYTRAGTSPRQHGIFRCPLAGCGPRAVDETQIYLAGAGTLALALDNKSVFWTTYHQYLGEAVPSSSGNGIALCPLAGCAPYAPTTVTYGEVAPWGVAVDASFFYWADHQKGRITRTPKIPR